jgi:ABC-2 type transport system permease protein
LKTTQALRKREEDIVKHHGQGARRGVSADIPHHGIREAIKFITKTLAIVELEIRKLRHDPTELITRAFQPALWMVVFGEVFTHARVIPTGTVKYMDFLAPGILAQGVLFVSIFYGIAVIWERDLGIVYKLLASPAPRSAIILGKALSAGVRGLSQSLVIYVLAILFGVALSFSLWSLLGVTLFILLGCAVFSTFSLIIACIVKTRERFMGIGQLLTMPFFFASNAIYPMRIMPTWLKVVSHINPLTYEVDALRSLMLAGIKSDFGLPLDFLVLVISALVLVLVGARLYQRMAT